MIRKLFRTVITAALIAALAACPVLAGTWTNVSPQGWQTASQFYIGDNGQYTYSKWVLDNNVWYWITADGTRATSYGISDDGYIYNDQGIWVPSEKSGTAYSRTGSGTVTAASSHAPSTTGYTPAVNHYRTSDYGPGAGGVPDPHR